MTPFWPFKLLMKPSVNLPLKSVMALLVATSRCTASSERPLSWTRTVEARASSAGSAIAMGSAMATGSGDATGAPRVRAGRSERRVMVRVVNCILTDYLGCLGC